MESNSSQKDGKAKLDNEAAEVTWVKTMNDGFVPFVRMCDNSKEIKDVKKDQHFAENLKDGWSGQLVRKMAGATIKAKGKVFDDGQNAYSTKLNEYVQVKRFEKDDKDDKAGTYVCSKPKYEDG